MLLISINLFATAPCDNSGKQQQCIGNALTIKVNQGLGAQYVDIKPSASLDKITDKMTVEMWMKPNIDASHIQYIAGVWGPSTDVNDVWQLYIDVNNYLVFEINGTNTKLKQIDNTIVNADLSGYLGDWFHIAAEFDGASQFASLFINGILVNRTTNSTYPASKLRVRENINLGIQIGSTNALSNNTNGRTFRGTLDEIRIWNKLLTTTEIICQKDLSLNDPTPNLLLYYRCNEDPNVFQLCDASNNGNIGFLRSGARCEVSDRKDSYPYIIDAPIFPDTVRCATSKIYTVTVTDTSLCGSQARLRIIDLPQHFKFNQNFVNLSPGSPTSFTFSLNTTYVGKISPRIYIDRNNRCGNTVFLRRIDIIRETDLKSNVDSLDLGIVKVNCQEEPYKEKTFQICNNTNRTGTFLDKVINGFVFGKPKFFNVISPTNFPYNLKPGECVDIKVRFYAGDTSITYFDTLNILSNDNCPGGGKIPIRGSVEQVLRLDKFGVKNQKADSMDFKTICIGYFAPAQLYVWENLSSSQIQVVGFKLPQYFESSNTKLPFNLDVKTSYRERYIRFAPTVAGFFQDSVVILVKSGACTVRRVIYVKGRAIDTKLDFKVSSVDFGNVIVGQEKTVNVDVVNQGNEPITVQFYLKSGSNYFLTGNKSLTLNPSQTGSFPITFRPISGQLYLDEVCYFEVKCFESKCISIKGTGIYERFLFEPEEMRTENVIACGSQLDTLFIKNNSGASETLNTFVLSDPGGKWSIVDPPLNNLSVTLANQEKQRFIFNYAPNDIVNDRADRAFLKYKTLDTKDWAAKLYGTSAIPKMFLSDNTAYGTIEVGDTKRKVINLENISSLPITIDSLASDSGFVIIYPTNIKGRIFYPRDTIQITVDFKPNYPVSYDGFVYAFSLSPCKNSVKGIVSGKGKVVPLEINTTIVAYGFVKPCDCSERKLAMANNSSVIDATIDSIYIDGQGIAGAYPEFFKWKSDNSPNGTFPFKIPFSTVDTLRVFYCPRSLALRDSIVHSAKVHIKTSGKGWTLDFDRFVTGKQMLFQEPTPLRSDFPPTRVNFAANAIYNKVTIPGIDVNPARDGLTIDSITFIPQDLVFVATDSLKRKFPITLIGNDTFKIKVDFKPKAPRLYNARMVIHYSKPCLTTDTTIIVTGSGFAPAFGLGIAFNPVGTQIDTVNIISCDTLFLPIYSDRKIPANAVDIVCRIGYDTTLFHYVGASSEYMKTNCINIAPKISGYNSKYGGTELKVENFCQVDSIKPFVIAKFLANQRKSVGTLFKVDSISFDTKDVILYQIIAQTDKIFVKTQNSDFKIDNTANFDSVRVLDCLDRDITITNTGEVKIAINEFMTYPSGVTLLSSIPAKDALIAPGESATLTLRYCPKKKSKLDDSLFYETIKPCYTIDSTQIAGIGYAPLLNISTDVSANFITTNTISANIGDTINVPVYFEKDLSATYKGVTYWIEKFNFDVNINYNPTALKFIDGQQTINSNFKLNNSPGKIDLNFKNVDTLKAGIVAQLKFMLTVPDSVTSDFNINATNFTTDSLLFLDLIGRRNLAIITNGQMCNLSTVFYTNKVPLLNQNYPNPWNEGTTIEFTTMERGVIDFKLYSSTGSLVKEYFNDGKVYKPGNYTISIKKDELESGTYFYELKTGINKFQKIMLHIK